MYILQIVWGSKQAADFSKSVATHKHLKPSFTSPHALGELAEVRKTAKYSFFFTKELHLATIYSQKMLLYCFFPENKAHNLTIGILILILSALCLDRR